MERLCEAARHRLFAYLYRLTLNNDLAQDLLQETLLKMVESIGDLEQPERFWGWLFRTALGHTQHYYRRLEREREIEFAAHSRRRLSEYIAGDHDDGLSRAMRKELCETVVEVMGRLSLDHRSVLALRCYEQMSYAQIAEQMGCKELRARVLFFRARRALSRQLTRRGFARGLLVTGLGIFGILTAPADSASAVGTVSAASLDVGLLAAFVGVAGTRAGAAVVLTIAGVTLTLTMEHLVYVAGVAAFALVCFFVALYME